MDHEQTLQPSVSKACSRCHARKVKCDLKVPRCAACTRHDEECNITECVAYPYAVVHMLQTEIADLKARLASQSAVPPAPQIVQREQSGWTAGKEAEEVGILAIGGPNRHSEDKYVGSATGSTFARIFFKQLNLGPSSSPDRRGNSLEVDPSSSTASLPPWQTARFLLGRYIARIHTWWPFLPLPHLRRTVQLVYQSPARASDGDKFIVFAVLALASAECQDDAEYQALMDLTTPDAYFNMAVRFFAALHDHPRDLHGIQAVLLLTLWMLGSRQPGHYNDLWHLSRYLMSAAIEAGLHRHNVDWGFSADELETRNRTWWCIYTLERHVAVVTGRVLSVRDHCVHALLPTTRSFDALDPSEALAAPVFHRHSVTPFRLMIRLRQIAGRILESVYIGRGPDGKALATSFQQICAASDESRRDLDAWRRDLGEAGLKPSREHAEMKVEHCLLQLLLNRPSPTFMVPSGAMVAACSRAASSAVRQWVRIEASHGVEAVCRSFRQLHSILLVGLAALYCDWYVALSASKAMTSDSVSRQFIAVARDGATGSARHKDDANTCLRLIREGIVPLQIPELKRYGDLLQAVKTKVYSASILTRAGPQPMAEPYTVGSVDTNAPDLFFSGDKGVEMYMSHVSSFFDDGVLDMDEALTAWYEAVMEEIQPPAGVT
ncbi:fungal-specific transcription factor domain-containing protein [Plectosphaerella plurivora]|uniref:Fungal-specific transcription factor domain-containing protein n=1 Tax=Plectosphaerella plurivora TaxID=936078 RepID=A0A9P8VLN9_9PEZI|nr:fungal-specific transcription factor domain-containing protein [Plectosphaerella plurivora]